MIRDAVNFLANELNQYMENRLGETDVVQLTHMLEDLNTTSEKSAVSNSKVGMTVINIEEERVTKIQGAQRLGPNGQLGKANPDIKLNLYILYSSRDSNYLDSLTRLDEVIKFFQSKNVFTKENSPALNTKFSRLMLDLYSLPLEQQNYIWGSLGAQYLPSVIYKVRLLLVQEESPLGSSTPITEIDTTLSGV